MTAADLKQNLIVQLGLENAPEELRLSILHTAEDLVLKGVMLRLMESLPPEDVAETNRLADDPEAMLEFMASRVEDFGGLVEAETQRVKNELVLGAAVPESD